jgi:hypothetical protein
VTPSVLLGQYVAGDMTAANVNFNIVCPLWCTSRQQAA